MQLSRFAPSVRRGTHASAIALALFLLPALGVVPAFAQEEATCPCPPPAPPPPLWTGSLGLSYLATSGNTDTESIGLSAAWSRRPTPWGIDIVASANRAETDGVKTAERLLGGVRGKRALSERFELFAGVSYEKNEFAGFDSRAIVEAGAIYRVLTGPVHELSFDGGLTWTTEEPVISAVGDDDWMGAVAGLQYVWNISDRAKFGERFLFYPNFDTSDDWRLSSETYVEASLAASWALRVSYLYLRDNLPPLGFEETDSTTAASLVWKR